MKSKSSITLSANEVADILKQKFDGEAIRFIIGKKAKSGGDVRDPPRFTFYLKGAVIIKV